LNHPIHIRLLAFFMNAKTGQLLGIGFKPKETKSGQDNYKLPI